MPPEFQKLESSWTGLRYLCKQTSTGESLKIKVLNTTKKELVKGQRLRSILTSQRLFKKVYEEEFPEPSVVHLTQP